ncbi:MAG: hypothetical protein IT256_05485, partial [Chitinophagaceae bacterium]|nr:hypothetical protein [Chitinophagaceae bacterium]
MKTELKDFGTLPDKETYIGLAFMYFDANFEKEKALWYAYQSKQYSDIKESKFRMEGEEVLKLYNKGMAYNIISFIYLWNDWFEEAYELESSFMNSDYWNQYNDLIERYI